MQYLKRIFFAIAKKRVYLPIVIIILLIDSILLFNNMQNKFPIIGLRFEGKPIIFYTNVPLQKLVQEEVNKNKKPILFADKAIKLQVYQADVGYTVDAAKTSNKLLLIGRKGNIFQKLVIQLKAFVGLENISLSGTVSRGLLSIQVIEIAKQLGHAPIPTHFDFAGDTTKIIPSQTGIQIDTNKLAQLIVQNINHPSEKSIPLPISVTYAKSYPNSTLENLRNQAKQLSAYPVSIISGGQQFTLNIQEIKNLLTVVERPNPKNAKQLEMFLRIDDTLLNQKLDLFAAKVESLTHAEFNEHDARIAIYNQLYTGNYSTPVIPTGGSIVSKNVLGVQTSDGPKIAYLTFDDGPNTIYQPLILDILKQYGIKATFFFIGQNIPNAHDVAVRTYSEGHLVGNHTWSHPFLPNLSSSAISNELTKADNILMSINGNLPVVFFRPPYGGINNLVVTDAHSNNLRIFLWDVDPRDWSEPPVDELVRRVVNATINGSNVLMHSNHLVTVRALPRIIETLKQEGYSFKTLGDYPKAEEL